MEEKEVLIDSTSPSLDSLPSSFLSMFYSFLSFPDLNSFLFSSLVDVVPS